MQSMDDWGIQWHTLPEEKDFYSTLNMKNNNGENYRLAKRV